MIHTISALVENHFGVLARVAGLFSSRGFNINSLTVGETHERSISRMTIVAQGDDRVLEQIMKQLNKLVDVIKVEDLPREEMIERELMLVKVQTEAKSRGEIMQIVDSFRAKIVDVSTKAITVEATGTESKVDALVELLRPYGIREMARTGQIAISSKKELLVSGKKQSSGAKTTKKKTVKRKKK